MSTFARNLLISLAISVAFHLVLLEASTHVKLENVPGMTGEAEHGQVPRLPVNVTLLKEEPASATSSNGESATEKGKEADEETQVNVLSPNKAAEEASFRLFENEKLLEPAPKPKLRFTGIENAASPQAIHMEIPGNTTSTPTAPRPEIVAIDMEKNVPEQDRIPGARQVIPKVERQDVSALHLPSLRPHGPLTDAASPTVEVSMRMSRPQFKPPQYEVKEEEMARGVTGVYQADRIAVSRLPGMELPVGEQNAISVQECFDVRVLVKDDPVNGGGHFVISIKANEKSSSLASIPKNVLLAIDHSGSISAKQLDVFKRISCNAIRSLKLTDRFNVVDFTNRPRARFSSFVEAIPDNKKFGSNFVNQLQSKGTTSVFAALKPVLEYAKKSGGRPLLIYLLTDGVEPDNIFTDDEFLRKINAINAGNVAIFPICIDREDNLLDYLGLPARAPNLALLEFLALQNRGEYKHATALKNAEDDATTFISRHSDLLLHTLKCTPAGIPEIYPKKLQHIYRNSDAKLYGRFNAGDDRAVLRIVGYDSKNQPCDIVIELNYAKAMRTQDPLDIQMAACKIMDLVSKKMMTSDDATRKRFDAEIRALSDKYALGVPY